MKTPVDLLLLNANVYTVDPNFAKCSAIAVKDGIILATGTDEEIRNAYSATDVHDLQQAALYPGFNDTHGHLLMLGESLQRVDLRGAKSFEEIIERLRQRYVQEQPDILIGDGWDQNLWPIPEFPDNAQLNKLFPDIPVLLYRIDFHAVIANRKAIEMRGLKPGDGNIPEGEAILKNGEFTGVFREGVSDSFETIIPKPTPEQNRKALLLAQEECFRLGLTSVSSAGESAATIELLDSMCSDRSLKLRLDVWMNQDPANFVRYTKPYTHGRLRVGTIKLFIDGALGSRGALMIEPYTDMPSTRGIRVISDETFYRNCRWAYDHDFQVATHAIGDAGNREVLKMYARLLPEGNDRRWRIEHSQIVRPEDLAMFGKYGIVPSIQPTHATSDMLWADERIGGRLAYAYAYRDLLRQSGWLPSGTDFPVEAVNPVYTFFAATARKNLDFIPDGGFQMENALTRREALCSMTIWAARSSFEEAKKGSIEPGKYADFTVLDKDIMTVDEKEIPTAKVLATYVGGERVIQYLCTP